MFEGFAVYCLPFLVLNAFAKDKKFEYLFFYSNDHDPVHVHVEKVNNTAKFTIEPVELVKSKGFNAKELKEVRSLVAGHSALIKAKWNEFFNVN